MHNTDKDEKQNLKEDDLKMNTIRESLLKANMKLDQVCTTTSETRTDIKSLNKDLQNIDTRVSVLEGEVRTLKERVDQL